ncbi:membrane assembly protein AsmA [Hafnia alvei FB1]|uniref:Membrane assembly protein AsmA n=1 Tax=Hafnia alvei FB1 TaxID=1453496 RepID=A0A097R3T5_HAFAL|nr:outer membrane assembly protein AsmA [Hafnia alvei]AIU73386.1 membrane assembly protein AsmA [Hafnia alvei FB1]KID05988.2 membrane assembly protein AsmA [Hafnia alvei]MBW3477326.1 outer membrane assembly protein AsmA [Hafnia alvei]TBL43382.1 outer membrane assembly protein AsmA [Hafnia alvei]TBL63605.1 outer membrane assembly protein AsmA [Hafnia alvei]
MRRFLTTIVILLVVLAVGMTALVLLVNPNDFRSYMAKEVQQRTGYDLQLDGSLRWHVWPRLSILSGRMSLTAPGAAQPVVSAENMRLDVALWPLLSHQLDVKQVMLKGAVIRLTPDSDAQKPENSPIAPSGSREPSKDVAWKLNIKKVQIKDSLLIWQQDKDDQINMRDINLSIDQDSERQAYIEFSSRINRNQRDLSFKLAANVDLSSYPQRYSAIVSSFDYHLAGVGLPTDGIAGQGSATVSYQLQPQLLDISNLQITANQSQLQGRVQGSVQADGESTYKVDLTSAALNLDNLLGWQPPSDSDAGSANTSQQSGPRSPVTSNSQTIAQPGEMAFLRDFNADVKIQANQIVYHGLTIADFSLQAQNQQGTATLQDLSGKLGHGTFKTQGTISVVDNQPAQMTLTPQIENIAMGPVLRAFGQPETFVGDLTLTGKFNGSGVTLADVMQRWDGHAHISMANARLNGMNIQQLIQQAVVRSHSEVTAADSYTDYTKIQELKADTVLRQGNLRITQFFGRSEILTAGGSGLINLSKQRCDMSLNVRVLDGWKGKSNVVKTLQKAVIPLRIYGPWQELSYSLDVDKVLRSELEQKAKDALNNWLGKHQDSKEKKDLERLLKKL